MIGRIRINGDRFGQKDFSYTGKIPQFLISGIDDLPFKSVGIILRNIADQIDKCRNISTFVLAR